MKMKPPTTSRKLVSKSRPHDTVSNWRNVPERDLWLYARSFHTAAKKLAGTVELEPSPMSGFDPCPVVFLYRYALELRLKAIVLAEGGNFLATRPDHLSIYKTHSVSWLAQFVCQIVIALKWEREFRCEGVENLAGFKRIIDEINSVEPGYGFRCPGQLSFNVSAFARRMDALLDLLDSTADALAATWDMQTQASALDDGPHGAGGFGPAIQ